MISICHHFYHRRERDSTSRESSPSVRRRASLSSSRKRSSRSPPSPSRRRRRREGRFHTRSPSPRGRSSESPSRRNRDGKTCLRKIYGRMEKDNFLQDFLYCQAWKLKVNIGQKMTSCLRCTGASAVCLVAIIGQGVQNMNWK